MAALMVIAFIFAFPSFTASQSFDERCSTFLQNLPSEFRSVCTCAGVSCTCSTRSGQATQFLRPCDAGLFIGDTANSQTSNSALRQAVGDLDMTALNPLLGVISRESEPVNHLQLLPLRPEEIATTFTVFDSTNRDVGMTIDYQNLTSITSFSGQYEKVYFVAHDIRESATNADYVQLKNFLLDYNNLSEAVVMVGWSGGAGFSGTAGCCSTIVQLIRTVHSQQAVNTMVVGRELGLVCFLLVSNLKITAQNIHLIGFGLGSHVMHFAAVHYTNLTDQDLEQQQFNSKIGRVTGLDPTARDFQGYTAGGISPFLSNRDALFVDIMHTSAVRSNGFGLDVLRGLRGMSAATGHIDFYPNGGQIQPGCSTLQGLRGCHHRRALFYFMASLTNQQAVRDNLEAYFSSTWRTFYDRQFNLGSRERLETINLQAINRVNTPGHVNIMGIQATKPNLVQEGLGLGQNTFFLFFQLDSNQSFVETDTARLPGATTVLNVVEVSRLRTNLVPDGGQFDFTRYPSHNLSSISERTLSDMDLPACGQFKTMPEARVSMGLDTYDGQFPWAVAIHSNEPDVVAGDLGLELDVMCTGSLLTNDLVVTAAHCFESFIDKRHRIVATNFAIVLTFGNDAQDPIAWRRVFLQEGVNFFIHPKFKGADSHDIAIIRMSEPLRGMPQDGVYTGTDDQPLNTLCWRSANTFTYEKQSCEQLYIAGFGLVSANPPIRGDVLLWSVYNVISSKIFNDPSVVFMINSEAARLRNLCPGDSGGPVMLYTRIVDAESLPARVSPFRGNLVATIRGYFEECDDPTDPKLPDIGIRCGFDGVYNWIRGIVDGEAVAAEVPETPVLANIPFPPSLF